MPFTIDDSANVPPAPLPHFVDLAVGDTFRLADPTNYLRKNGPNTAYSFTNNAVAALADGLPVEPVDAKLVIE